MAGILANKPTVIEHKDLHFLIMDAPTNSNIDQYVKALKSKGANTVVRACDPTYDTTPLTRERIDVLDLPFADGDPPPIDVVNKWLNLVEDNTGRSDGKNFIAVHCVAGLGRAPVLVAIALVEAGMEPLNAISFIRKRRRGAINAKQIKYLQGYERQAKGGCCIIA